MKKRTAALLVGALLIGGGCDSPEAAARLSRPVNGDHHVLDVSEARQLSARTTARIGALEGDSSEVFHRVLAGYLGARGNVVLSNSGGPNIRVYSRRFDLLQWIGRRGGGPGEFIALRGVAPLGGDSILAYDGQMSRFSVFDPEGRFARSFRLDAVGLGGRQPVWFRDTPAGLLVAVSTGLPEVTMYQDLAARDTIALILYAKNDSTPRELGGVPNRWWQSLPNERAYELRAVIEGPYAVTGGSADRVYFSSNDSAVVRSMDLTGRALDVWSLEGVAPAAADSGGEYGTPFFQRITVGTDGAVWLSEARTTRDDQRRWYRLLESGSEPAVLTLPATTTILDSSGEVVLVRDRDEFDVHHLRLLEVALE